MIWFADSSTLVKLYVDEVGFEEMRKLALEERLAVSAFAWVEVRATLNKKKRTGELRDDDALSDARRRFAADWRSYLRASLDDALLEEAVQVSDRHGLRAYDAIQLSSAMRLRRFGLDIGFVCADRELTLAAQTEGFEVRDLSPPA